MERNEGTGWATGDNVSLSLCCALNDNPTEETPVIWLLMTQVPGIIWLHFPGSQVKSGVPLAGPDGLWAPLGVTTGSLAGATAGDFANSKCGCNNESSVRLELEGSGLKGSKLHSYW